MIVLMGGTSGGGLTPPGDVVDSFAVQGQAQLSGDVTLSAGPGITLTQVGQDIEIAAS